MADPVPSASANSNLTTSFYHTTHGLVVLTWSRTFLHNALSIDIHIQDTTAVSFRLRLTPWLFWKKKGSKAFSVCNPHTHSSPARIEIHWDLTRAKFHSGPEPHSGFFVAVTYDEQMLLLLGDSHEAAYSKTKSSRLSKQPQLLMRREHVFGSKSYTTRANFGGKAREILIECGGGSSGRDDSRLSISIEGQRILHVKRLKWKFRGNEKLDYDGVPVQVSWDVYNWLFDDGGEDDHRRHAVFIFRFENEFGEEEECHGQKGLGAWKVFGLGLEGLEKEKMKMKRKKRLLKTMSSSSSSSSSVSSQGSSVMEWASCEEKETQITGGFSLLVYAWRS